jgi:hypothetical protein
MHRGALGFAVAATGASLAACGATEHSASVSTASATARAAAAATATATATPVVAAQPVATPTPIPTPAPPPAPVLVVRQGDYIEGVDGGSATPLWSFKPDSVVGTQNVSSSTAGSNLLLAGGGSVAVVDRGGVVIGRGSYVLSTTFSGPYSVYPDPAGRRWTWSTVDSAPQTTGNGHDAPWTGAVWVAGIGEAPHRVQQWTEPSGTTVEVFLWSDRGIVTAVVPGTCSPTLEETSTAVLDPATGRSVPLAGGDRHVVDVHRGLVLALRQPTTLLVGGAQDVTLTERPVSQGEHFVDAAISPDGAHVYGSMTSMSGCGGIPQVRTVVVDAATHAATTLPDVFAEGWYDNAHLVVHAVSDDKLRIVDLNGGGSGQVVTHGWLIGVLG